MRFLLTPEFKLPGLSVPHRECPSTPKLDANHAAERAAAVEVATKKATRAFEAEEVALREQLTAARARRDAAIADANAAAETAARARGAALLAAHTKTMRALLATWFFGDATTSLANQIGAERRTFLETVAEDVGAPNRITLWLIACEVFAAGNVPSAQLPTASPAHPALCSYTVPRLATGSTISPSEVVHTVEKAILVGGSTLFRALEDLEASVRATAALSASSSPLPLDDFKTLLACATRAHVSESGVVIG
ncbi:MAG: hypothetical protein J0L92_32730 [Deltaproteobacteria bacterium]|nr:hypothetical protein [Deltaproteobacteria bacterium]